ncbi:MAG: hypothetical protein AAFX76_03815, partial [Planctomycetota bacterium]
MPSSALNQDVDRSPAVRHGLGPALLWACFLGCSWTWVIGMLLPVMLVRDLGVAGWWVFAVPNVVGAAAMGFVLGTPEAARRVAERHSKALSWFAAVTIVYQVYVVCWLFGGVWLALLCVLPWMVLDAGWRHRLGVWLPGVAVGVAVLSWGVFSRAGRLEGAWLDVGADTFASRLGAVDLWIVLPGYTAGFLLCPYLDPTFHRARVATGPGTG